MLAQGQYLFYKMATEKKMSPDILSKTALQISAYFMQAYDASQQNNAIKAFESGQWCNIMKYHALYFEACAW